MAEYRELEKLKQEADSGKADSCYELGEYYYEQKDYETAFYWYQKTTECINPNPTAFFNIGCAYQFGEGVPRDLAEAFRYYEYAAKYNLPQALFNLAFFYENGFIAARDCEKAEEYCRRATCEINRVTTKLHQMEEKEKQEKSIFSSVETDLRRMREKMDDQGRDIKECRKLAETHSLLAGQIKKFQEQERELNQRCIRNEGENAQLREQHRQDMRTIQSLQKDKNSANELLAAQRNDIQDLQKRNESFLNQSHFFQMQCENLKQMLHEAEKRAGHSLKVTGILKWIIFGETVVLTACAGIMFFLLLSF